jgi:hypothetical protein
VTIDIPLGGPARAQPAQFATVVATMKPLLGSLAPVELAENADHGDLTF